jgi:peptide/nickel transport system substrate-binding protein
MLSDMQDGGGLTLRRRRAVRHMRTQVDPLACAAGAAQRPAIRESTTTKTCALETDGKGANVANQGDDIYRSFLNKTFTRRDLLKGAAMVGAGAALAPVLAACGDSGTTTSPSASAAGTPKMGGHLRVAAGMGSAKETLDAHATAFTMQSMDMRFNMYDSLLEYSPEGVQQMALAESIEPNSTGTEYVVKLKPDLVFHDGSPVNADAVVYTFDRIMNPKNPQLAANQLRGLKPGGAKKVDDLTISFKLSEANVIFPEALATYSAAIVPVGYDPKGGTGAIGTGPFMLAQPSDFKPGVEAVFVKNPNYWREGGGPYVDKLSIIEFADTTAQLNALIGGTVEWVQMIPGAQREVATGAGMKLLEAKTGSWIPFTMNCEAKPFNDPKVRQAFRLIVDRPQMITQAADGLQWLGNDMYAPYDPGYPKDLPQRAQDIEQAKALLKEAGQENLAVKLVTSTSVSNGAPAAATVFAQQAKAAGVDVKVENVTGDVFWGDDYLTWPFAMDNWGTRGYLAQAGMGTVPGALYDETHWSKGRPDYMKIVNEAYQTVDETKRNELIAAAATMEYEDGGYIIHAFDIQVDAYSPKVAGGMPDYSGLGSAAANARYRLMYFA